MAKSLLAKRIHIGVNHMGRHNGIQAIFSQLLKGFASAPHNGLEESAPRRAFQCGVCFAHIRDPESVCRSRHPSLMHTLHQT